MASEDGSEPVQPQYPGVNLPLRHLDNTGGIPGHDYYRLGSFQGAQGVTSEMIQVREVVMMLLMDRLTDKPDWQRKVFDEEIVAKWREEALSMDEADIYLDIIDGRRIDDLPLPKRTRFMSAEAFDYCIAELRDKATYFEKTGLIFTLNSDINTAIKSDSVVGDGLRQGLKAAFEKLRADQASEPDWHPWSDEKVQDLVHPSLYPFVYGKTRFIQEEVVGVEDAIDHWSGKGDVVPRTEGAQPVDYMRRMWRSGDFIDRAYWSNTYQWLPANLAFKEDGTVRFTSYINNLHPKKHAEIYTLVEKLIDTAIPAWDRVLGGRAVNEQGSVQKRMCSVGPVDEDNENGAWEAFDAEILAAHEAEAGPVEIDAHEVDWMAQHEANPGETAEETNARREKKTTEAKWEKIRDPILPQPREYEPVTFKIKTGLRKRFQDSGLQVIVKMASIELTPDKPDFPAGGWHVEGMLNEHIVATALYYLDSENVTPSHLSFRMQTTRDQDDLQDQVGQDQYHSYERIFGTSLSPGGDGYTLQTYGSVETREGRLLAFPNVFQHRVSSFGLQDRTKPGHRRFIALWLVDPLQRIVSTGNVPPQQLDWWAEAVFGAGDKATTGDMPPELFQLLLENGAGKAVKPSKEMLQKLGNRLPAEVMEMVRREMPGGLPVMTAEEAKQHRLELMEERRGFVQKTEQEWKRSTYSFCEH